MKPMLREVELTNAGPARHAPRRGQRAVTVNLAESPLTWLHARGHLSDGQLAAGECLRRDWEWAELAPGVTMRWDAVRVHGGGERGLNPTERQISARQRFDGAIAAADPHQHVRSRRVADRPARPARSRGRKIVPQCRGQRQRRGRGTPR